MDENKICRLCGEEKPTTEFFTQFQKGRLYVKSVCKLCYGKGTSAYRADRMKTIVGTIKQRLMSARGSARKRNHNFDITLQDVLNLFEKQQGLCFYTGQQMGAGNGGQSVSIDRINTNVGYLKENIVLCCWDANRLKNDFPVDEFIRLCQLVADHSRSRQPNDSTDDPQGPPREVS